MDGRPFVALYGGPHFRFNEEISAQVMRCEQPEVDYYRDKLAAGGQEGQCGCLKDRFGA